MPSLIVELNAHAMCRTRALVKNCMDLRISPSTEARVLQDVTLHRVVPEPHLKRCAEPPVTANTAWECRTSARLSFTMHSLAGNRALHAASDWRFCHIFGRFKGRT